MNLNCSSQIRALYFGRYNMREKKVKFCGNLGDCRYRFIFKRSEYSLFVASWLLSFDNGNVCMPAGVAQ